MSQKTDPLEYLLEIKRHVINKILSGAPKLYVLQENNSACVLFSLSTVFDLIGDKISVDCFKDAITPSLKANVRIKFAQDMAMNHVREKLKSI